MFIIKYNSKKEKKERKSINQNVLKANKYAYFGSIPFKIPI